MDKENYYLIGFNNKKGKLLKWILDGITTFFLVSFEIALERAKDNNNNKKQFCQMPAANPVFCGACMTWGTVVPVVVVQ